jgi:hypothetical protein
MSGIVSVYLLGHRHYSSPYPPAMPTKKRRNDPAPDPPANAEGYVLVRTKEGPYWRKKRGTTIPASLNKSYQQSADTTALASPAAKRIRDRLEEFLKGLDTGRFIANVSGKLRKVYHQKGEFNFSLLEGYELQPYHPLSNLLQGHCYVRTDNNILTISIPVDEDTVKQQNKIVSGFYFEAILLYGDPGKNKGLKLESEISPLYTFNEKTNTECLLRLSLPVKKTPWMALLKVSCLEGNTLASHPRHYGMKVVKTG